MSLRISPSTGDPWHSYEMQVYCQDTNSTISVEEDEIEL